MERFVYIDETGDLGEKGTQYFVITAIWVDNPAPLDRIIKNARRNKFKKQLKSASEIKANDSSEELIEYLLKEFSKIESAHTQTIILEKKKIFSKFLKNDKNKLYNYVCSYLSNIAIDSRRLIIRIDRSKGKEALIEDFNTYIEKKFKETRWVREVEIYHSYSHAWSGLQIADIVSWAVFRKFEYDNDYFFKIIENKTIVVPMWK